jgi:hypothetical protein
MLSTIKKALLFVKHEILEMLPPTIFFLVVFHTIAFTRALMDEQYGISVAPSFSALISALIVGKAVLIADALPFINWFSQKRHIYNVTWRTFLYVILVLLFHFLEELIPLISKFGAITTASEHLIEEIKWPRFWATLIIITLFLVIFNVLTAVKNAIGGKRFLEIFLTSKSNQIAKVD